MKVDMESKIIINKDLFILVVESIKIKNSKGFNKMCQKIIKEGLEHLIESFTPFFDIIYAQRPALN